MNKLYLVLLTFIISIGLFAQDSESEVFYIMPDQEVFDQDSFNIISQSIEEQDGRVKLLDTIQRDGNLFINISIKSKKSGRNPYQPFINKIGEKFPLSDFGIESNDKPLFINFWFTTCPPCIKEIPDLNALKEIYGDKVDFYAITFNSQEQVDRFEKKRPVHFEHITGQQNALRKFGVSSYPMNMVLDKDGTIRYVSGMIGYDFNEFKYELNKLLVK